MNHQAVERPEESNQNPIFVLGICIFSLAQQRAPPNSELLQAVRFVRVLEDIEDDLRFHARLKELWCVEDVAGCGERALIGGVRGENRIQYTQP